jgi:carbonic anhydrase/acetyltransferase-like protein (isoleucine patch superfamily)
MIAASPVIGVTEEAEQFKVVDLTTMPLAPYLHTAPVLGERVYLHPSCQVIGDVTLGDDSSVWCNTVLRADVNRIVIGRGTNVQDLTVGHVSHKTAEIPDGSPLIVGDYVTVGHSVILHGCIIGNECLIGMGSVIMDDVVIPDRVMIAAGSLISPGKKLESGMLYMGRPAKAVRALTEKEIADLMHSAEHYMELKDNYLRGSASSTYPL